MTRAGWRTPWIGCILSLLVAAALRLLFIDTESLWVDEGFSYWAIRHEDMFRLVLNDVHPPVYFYMLRAWASVAGITELALRYFSVLPSMLSVAMLYRLAHEIERRRGRRESRVPALAALMLALADMEIYIAQETRMYAWHVLWVIVSMWAFLRTTRATSYPVMGATYALSRRQRETTRTRYGIVWFVSTLLLLYTQYIGAAAVAVQGVYTLLFLRGKMRRVALGVLTLLGVLFIPWLIVIATTQTSNVGTGFNVPSTLESLWNWRARWFTGQWALMFMLAVWGGYTLAICQTQPPSPALPPSEWGKGDPRVAQGKARLAPTVGYDGNHRLFSLRTCRQRTRFTGPGGEVGLAFLLLAWVIVPVTGAYIFNTRTPILMDYRLTQITPAIALLIAFGLGNLRGVALRVALVAIVIYGVTTDDAAVKRPPWREVGQNAARYAVPGDLALAHIEPSGDWHMMYYYERFMPQGVERRSLRQWKLEHGDTYAGGLPALLDRYDHVWLMQWAKDRSGFEALAAAGHVQTAIMTEDWLGNALNVYRFDRVPPPEDALAVYENGMTLRDAVVDAGTLRVDLWWSAPNTLDADYTVSAFLLDATGRLVAQWDSYPFDGGRPTGAWQPDEVIYDPHLLTLADGFDALPPGPYTAGVKVYLWLPDGVRVVPTTGGAEFARVGDAP